MIGMRRRLTSDESGAVAVLFALLAVVVIGAGALAVDLGNAFARKRISQTQADLAALAGAARLPQGATTAAVDEAFNYLVRNVTPNQGEISTYKSIMTNGSQDDGEIWVEADSRINVLTPPAEVDYALGGVFQQYGIDVQAYAQAGVFSPGLIAPFFIPYGCSVPGLPDNIFVKSGAESTPTEPTPEFLSPMAASKKDPPIVDTVTPTEIGFGPSVSTRDVSDVNMEADDPTFASLTGAISEIEVTLGVSVTVSDATFVGTGPPVDVTDATVAGDTVTTTVADSFEAGDVGSKIEIPGAGLAGAPRITIIDAVVSDTEVRLATPASTDVGPVSVTLTPGTVGDLSADAVLWLSPGAVDLDATPDLDIVNGSAAISITSTDTVEITGEGFSNAGLGMEVGFVRGAAPHPTIFVPAADVKIEKYKTPKRDAIENVVVPTEVVSTADSEWYIQVRIIDSAGNPGQWSFAEDKKNEAILSISSSADPADECGERVTGDFGLLNSPRADTNQLQERLDLNIAIGIDHGLQEFPDAELAFVDITLKDNCRVTPGTPVTGGILDEDATVASGGVPNCLEINNGNKVDATTDGLITGGTKPFNFDGRLDKPSSELCPRPLRSVLGTSINNDVLTCFLDEGTLQSAIDGTTDTFLGEIVSSPRFMFVPVLWATVNPQNGFYPIERFVGAYITEQDISTPHTSTTGSNDPVNGVPVGSTKVQGINVIPFELDRLPEQVDFDGDVIDYIGSGPKVVRLIK